MSVVPQEHQERIPIWQVLFDDFFLLFLLGVAVPFVFYTVWGLIDIGSIPTAKPIVISASVAPPPAGALVVETTMSEFKFQIAQTSLPVSKPVRFNIANKGGIEHEFIVEKAGAVNQPLKSDGQSAKTSIVPGASGYLDWTFAEPGQYQIRCHISGHYEAGMVARITVR
ncbi:MAG: multicopper oxidase domain-containing protein [Chloroflexi bacterium]|nr:multicopper oxidase domain-containing protein [Chloroflexota bacterium]